MSPRVLPLLAVTCALALVSAPAAFAAHEKDDLQALQGRWERDLAGSELDAHKGAAKAVKEIKGNKETVTYINEGGDAVYATTAEFKLEHAGRVTLYTYWNLKVTKGKDEGTAAPSVPVSYIYRVDGDLYHEAHGLLVDSPTGAKPTVITWKRAK